MEDISDYLLANEQSVFQTQPHWVVYSLTLALGGMTVLSLFLPIAAWEIALIGVASALVTGFFAAVTRNFTAYVITNKRVFKKTGWISRSTSGLLLDKIESVDVRQTIVGRILGFGDVLLRGTGGGVDAFMKVAKPFEFRRQLAHVLSQR
jgi:uncharacterized membrane protein YdbT with pleckstrin-like domain